MSLNLKKLALAREIEDALKNYLGTDSFPTEEWPALALAIADVVVHTGYVDGLAAPAPVVAEHAAELVRKLARLNETVADIVGL